MSTLTPEQLTALQSGQYEDVFSVLGMHEHPAGKGLVVRVLLPGATAVDVIDHRDGRKVAALDPVGEEGLFEGALGRRRKRFDYYLRARFGEHVSQLEDPYRFGPQLDDHDLYLFGEGTQEQAYRWMGAHPRRVAGVDGMLFVVWAPAARRVSVVGPFNEWDGRRHVMRRHPASGVWELFIPAVAAGEYYKYEIVGSSGRLLPLKADPYAFAMQHPPRTAAITPACDSYHWRDEGWMRARDGSPQHYRAPVSIYEVHAGSWRRDADNGYLSYRELAEQLLPYIGDLGFTHIQLMPVSEYPFDGSWGYQPIGLYAPTRRFGTPDDFRYFIDCCHQQGIGVLLDWVPGHFPTDEHGIGRFDGSCLYEHEDPRKGFHPDWNTLIYNYGRGEVISYLLSNALYWLRQFHIDGLRVDAVASMLYLDYSRENSQWLPNVHGGRENLEAMALLQQVNSRVYFNHPGAMMVAEESTAWAGVSRPVSEGGLGFGFKWNMGWMNDTLRYMARDPIHRQFHHHEMTFSLMYSFSENFVLPLSHDEVVHGKRSLLHKMPGDRWQQFANLRAYLGFMWTHPGKKLLFMGGEFAQEREWNHDHSLDWHLLDGADHRGVQNLVRDLNRLYREIPALHQLDCDESGFEWIEADNHSQSIFVYLRRGGEGTAPVVVVVNMTPETHSCYTVGVPLPGLYRERLNTDSEHYGGSNQGNGGAVKAQPQARGKQPCQLTLRVPPLATVILEWTG
ncbi:1,4-alpha-glucan branching protein GlgB [Seongchinamella sediminis]|uniref:1,4-alpha-glucan branching enzyme GlgB n=1 Tax=Seongchinamella sediminis TaxID=2283635 RepID=A0A3L7E2N5_9GAMM|nr:1,4-alpha-glucan branching protein GlgB [Seongchinamella sediminis]RLQ22482.1 1,4-alpha-glucan branching protein GlgB [Seongchinamella sediminis]